MFLSVIIPTCNRNDLLSLCLEQLKKEVQKITEADYEIIVTDDSRDNIAKQLIEDKFQFVKWIQGPKKGPAANRNNGVKNAAGEWVVFIDDDCIPDNNWLRGYLNAIKSDRANVYEGKTIADRPKQRFDEESPVNLEGGVLWSCNFAIKQETFLNINGFDEFFPYPALEDSDFGIRIKKNEEIIFVSEAIVVHPWRRVKAFKSYKKWLASNKYFAKKYAISNTFKYRFSRAKILIGHSYSLAKELSKFSFKGIGFYFEIMWFNFLMIFI